MCRCGQPMQILPGSRDGFLRCGHCDLACDRDSSTCANCRAVNRTTPAR